MMLMFRWKNICQMFSFSITTYVFCNRRFYYFRLHSLSCGFHILLGLNT